MTKKEKKIQIQRIKDLLSSDKIQEILEKTFVIPKYGTTKLVDLILNKPQKTLVFEMHDRNIVLKARKEGFTTLIAAICIIICDMFPNIRVQFLADNDANTLSIFNKIKNLVERAKYTFKCEISKRDIIWENGSSLIIATAGRKSAGRGDDFHIVHFSEIATFEYPDVYEAVLEACPQGALVFMESTANGRNLFYDLWERAVKGFPKDFDFKPFFFGWDQHPENIRPVPQDFKRNQEEVELQAETKLTDQQIFWRHWKLSSMPNPEKFPQEHPLTPGEAFLASGQPVFSTKALDNMKQVSRDYRLGDLDIDRRGEVKFADKKGGFISVYQMPQKNHDYVIGADCAEGVEGGDYNAACVIDTQTNEQVAEFHTLCDPDQYAYELNKLGRFYNFALLAVERNNHGFSVISDLVNDYNYPNMFQEQRDQDAMYSEGTENYGFRTNTKTRPIIVDIAKRVIRKGLVKLNSADLINECLSFITTKTGKAMHDQGKHDDRVFSLMIGLYVFDQFPEIQEQKVKDGSSLYHKLFVKQRPIPKKNVGRGGY